MDHRSAESGATRSRKVKLRLVAFALLAFVLFISSPWWAAPLTRVRLGARSLADGIRLETVGDDMWRGFNAIERTEGTMSRKEVLKRLGEPVESVPPGSPIPEDLAQDWGVPKHEDGEGGLFIYESIRPMGHCFIFFNAEGNVERVVTRSLE